MVKKVAYSSKAKLYLLPEKGKKKKKKSSELLQALTAAKEGRVWTDGKMNAEDPAQIWLGAFGRVMWPMLSHCRFGL